jgi:hypothetical protein
MIINPAMMRRMLKARGFHAVSVSSMTVPPRSIRRPDSYRLVAMHEKDIAAKRSAMSRNAAWE